MTSRTDRWTGAGRWLAGGALALAIAGALGGCRHVPGHEGFTPTYRDPSVFTIAFTPCPSAATVVPEVRNCPDLREDCVRVKGGAGVRFEASPLKNDKGEFNDFVLHFDPFDRNTIESASGVVQLVTRRNPKGGKPYTFVVTAKAPGCPDPVDPQIILD